MINKALADLDLFNYYAVNFLELGGNFSPTQEEINRMEGVLKKFFKLHVDKMRSQLMRAGRIRLKTSAHTKLSLAVFWQRLKTTFKFSFVR